MAISREELSKLKLITKEDDERLIKEERKEYMKQYSAQHYLNNKEKIKECWQKWYRENKGKIKERNKQYYEENKEKLKLSRAEYGQTEAGKAVEKKAHHKRRRGLGFIPLNEPFESCVAHHFNKEGIIYIPVGLHQSVWHNVFTGKSMQEINRLAFGWLEGTELVMPMESWMR